MFVVFFEGSYLQNTIFNSYIFTSVSVILQFSVMWFRNNFKNPIFQIIKIFDESRNRSISSWLTFKKNRQGSPDQFKGQQRLCPVWNMANDSKVTPVFGTWNIQVHASMVHWRLSFYQYLTAVFLTKKSCHFRFLKGTPSVKVIIEIPVKYWQLDIYR